MKKLIPALCMLLVAASLLGTSTYAWFSMNEHVEATGLQVTAKSNTHFLLINNTGTPGSGSEEEAASHATVGNDDKKTYPVAYYATAGDLNGHTTEAGKWYTTTSSNASVAVEGNGAITEVTEGDKDYMLTYKVWLTLSDSSENVSNKAVKVTFNGGASDAAIKAVVKIGSSTFALSSASTNATTPAAVPLSKDDVVLVTVYVYVDGNSEHVNNTYFQTTGITGNVSLTFDLV